MRAKLEEERADKLYKSYVTDSLYYSAHSMAINQRYIDLLEVKVDTRSGAEIALDVMAKAGLKFKDND